MDVAHYKRERQDNSEFFHKITFCRSFISLVKKHWFCFKYLSDQYKLSRTNDLQLNSRSQECRLSDVTLIWDRNNCKKKPTFLPTTTYRTKKFMYQVNCKSRQTFRHYILTDKCNDFKLLKETKKWTFLFRGLRSLGVPCFQGSGSRVIRGVNHRFVIIDRFGSNLQQFFNGGDLGD